VFFLQFCKFPPQPSLTTFIPCSRFPIWRFSLVLLYRSKSTSSLRYAKVDRRFLEILPDLDPIQNFTFHFSRFTLTYRDGSLRSSSNLLPERCLAIADTPCPTLFLLRTLLLQRMLPSPLTPERIAFFSSGPQSSCLHLKSFPSLFGLSYCPSALAPLNLPPIINYSRFFSCFTSASVCNKPRIPQYPPIFR